MAITTPKQIRPAKPAGPATILVVDDSKESRELYRATLQQKGYQVLSAESGENALQVCRAHKGLINLVVMDVVMPGMSGLRLATKLLPLRPNLKVLFVSGYMQQSAVQSGLRSIDGYLSKPFPAGQLLTKIREMLAS